MKQFLLKSILCVTIALLCFSVYTKAQHSINFSGNSGNGATASYNFDLNNGFTVEYEMYINALTGLNGGVTSTNSNEPSPVDTYIDNTGNMSILIGNGGVAGAGHVSGFVAGQWYNIAITWDATSGHTYVYVNGVQQATFSAYSVANIGNITIGDRADNATFANSGFDRVLIWSGGARSAAQVMADQYTCFTGSEPNLDVYYNMSENAGTTLNNLGGVGTASNATITGPVTWTGGSDSCNVTATAINTYYSPSGKHKWTTSGYHVDTMACGTIVYVNLTLTHLMYVSPNGSGADGMSWATAYTNFANAVDSSMTGDTILVAQGTYQAASGKSFTMKDNVKIYGGFAGTETGLAQRNLQLGDTTVLEGNGAPVIDNTSNALTNAAVLDGFVITGGIGGGMNNTSSSPTLINLVFINNKHNGSNGGGMSNSGASPILTNIVFVNNSAGDDGGGMYNAGASPTLTNVVFYNNVASGQGGAMANEYTSSPTITNATFSNNNTSLNGGAIFNSTSTATIINTVFWGNTIGGSIQSDIGGSATLTYCYTQTTIAGTGNIKGTQDPFVNDANKTGAQGADAVWMTADDGLHLVTGSAAIGAGNVSAIPAGVTTDITAVTAIIQSALVNMGAYANTCQTESFISPSACSSYNSPSGKYTWTTSGMYTDTIPNHATCDSVIHVNLTINYPTTTDTNATVCNYIKWYGDSIIQTGIYTYTLTAKITGCDSTIQLRARVNHSAASAINIGTYASTYKFKGTTETASGHYAFDTTSVAGCDSIVNLYLTLYSAPTISGGGCIPANLTFSGNPLPVLIQWQNGGVAVATDTAKWNAGIVVAQDRIDGNSHGVAIDTAGNVYVGDQSQVFKYPKGATAGTPGVTVAKNGISIISDIKVDIKGNLFVEDGDNQEVYEFPVGSDSTTSPTLVASGFSNPEYLFVDNADNIYVSDNNSDVVWYYPAGNSKGTVVAQTGINRPGGLYVDNSGNLFVSDFGNNDVLKYTKGSTSSTNASIVAEDELTNADFLGNVTVDGNGYVYVENAIYSNSKDSSVIYIYSPGSNASTHPIDSIILPGMFTSFYFTTDASGNVYALSNYNRTVEKYSNIIKMTDSVKTGGSYTAMVNSFSGSSTTTNAILVGPHPTIHVAGQDSIMLGSVDTLIASGTATSYLWSPSGQSTDSIKVSPGATTTYTVTATLSGCSDTATFTVKIEILTGVRTISTQGSVRAYPNPAVQTLNLTFNSGNTQDATIDVVDLAGQVVISKNTTISNGEVLPIDISRLAAGNYLVKIRTANSSQTLKFVKQ